MFVLTTKKIITTFAVLFDELEGLDKPDCLIYRATNRKIVDCDLPDNS